MTKIYRVGGCVRDEFLAVESKDIDLVMVTSSYDEMKEHVVANSTKIFLEKPEFGTIRYLDLSGKPVDMSLSIKHRERESNTYTIGTIEEDLANRDFTMNAIAKCLDTGEYIDPLEGIKDIENKIIKTCSSPDETFRNDPIRIYRAFRFRLRLAFKFDSQIATYLEEEDISKLLEGIEKERLRKELDDSVQINSYSFIDDLYSVNKDLLRVPLNLHGIKFRAK
jgi:tRNA nucleotidyltransferase/poly(A) polymerase